MTVMQALSALPEPLAYAAVRNSDPTRRRDDFAYRISDALDAHACWARTSQGHDYWSDIFNRLTSIECGRPTTLNQNVLTE